MLTLDDSNERATLLKSEERTRIEVRRLGGLDTVLRKVYRTPSRLRWRTFLLPSRASREFHALKAAFDLGLPCVEPISFLETRRFACVASSEVVSSYVPGRSLKAVLAAGLPSRPRRKTCVQLGELLRRLHESGILWMSAMPRNIVLCESGLEAMVACDFPYGLSFRKSIVNRKRALVDLYSMGFSKSRLEDFSESDRRAFLIAYCRGDRASCRSLWTALTARTKRRQTIATTIMHSGAGVLIPAASKLASIFTRRRVVSACEPTPNTR
jgi:tRNA A-37 threonylcarbamoyl transferase component Bud32